MNDTPLNRLAQRTSTDPFFLGFRLVEYARIHELDDLALASRLGCDLLLLPTIRLCRAPRLDRSGFREDVICVAEKFGLKLKVLAEAAKCGLATIQQRKTPPETQAAGAFLAARDREEPS